MTRKKPRSDRLFLTSADASRLLGVTPAAVRLMVERGAIRVAARTMGGIRLFRRAEVDRLARRRAQARRRTETPEASS